MGAWSPAGVTVGYGAVPAGVCVSPAPGAPSAAREAADGLCVLSGFVRWIWLVKMILAIQKALSLSHKVSFISFQVRAYRT